MKPPRSMLALRSILLSRVKPFHDDKRLQGFICEALARYRIATFIETGTFRGDSLVWLASKFPHVKCVSTEVSRPYYAYAKFHALPRRNVTIFREDSRQFLLGMRKRVRDPVLFWLDAHGRSDWPLLGELKTIRELYKESLALIDDFQVPGRPGFTFDTYNGRPLNLEYIRGQLDEGCEVWLPDYQPSHEMSGTCAVYIGMKGFSSPDFRRVSVRELG